MSEQKSTPKGRHDAVFIRKSGEEQNEQGQKSNVLKMLVGIGVSVPDEYWFIGTVGRRKVRSNASFRRLMELVENDNIGTVYVESQDRWGTSDRPELFNLLGTLRDHGTRLYDLRDKKDLTERDLATEMLAFFNSVKSEQELKDISYRSLRTRVNNFKETGSWPTGPHPFGYGKECRDSNGALLWVWQPVSRTRGQIFNADSNGNLKAGLKNQKIPRKDKRDKITLVPNSNEDFTESIRLVFDLYTRVGLSRRKISAHLNSLGYQYYSKPFTHPLITQILKNAAYVGDTHFGKTRAGELHSFDAVGEVIPLPTNGPRTKATEVRNVAEQIVKKNTHKALIQRKTWNAAQTKLKDEQEHTSFSPRNPAYYLKPLFVCGHCGRGMAGRTETQPRTKKRTVVYVCSTYMAGRSGGHDVDCGYQRITHEDAEKMLLAKIDELDLKYDELASTRARNGIQQQLTNLDQVDQETTAAWSSIIMEGVNSVCGYLAREYGVADKDFKVLRRLISRHFWQDDVNDGPYRRLGFNLDDLRKGVTAAEELGVERAQQMVAQLGDEHSAYTKSWVVATDMQKDVLEKEITRIEAELAVWQPRTKPLSERLELLYDKEARRKVERKSLAKDLPMLACREKGEAFRRLFKTVTLYWDREFIPARKGPHRKTKRPGRYRYTLRHDQTDWDLTALGLEGSW